MNKLSFNSSLNSRTFLSLMKTYALLSVVLAISWKSSVAQPLLSQQKTLRQIKEKSTELVENIKSLIYSKKQLLEIKVPSKTDDNPKLVSIKKYIPLETTKDFLISGANQIDLIKGKYYIFDKDANAVLIFHADGKFFKRIHDAGNGANKYVTLGSMYVSEEANQLILFDVQRKRFSFYDLDGNFIGVKSSVYWNKGFSMFPNGEFCYYLTKTYNTSELLLTDTKLIPKKRGIDKSSSGLISFYTFTPYIKDFGKYKLVMPAFRDTLYQFNQDSLYAKYAINYNGTGLPDGYWKKGLANFSNEFKTSDYSLGDFFENDRFVGLNIEHNSRTTQLIYSKSSGNVFYGDLKDRDTQLPLFYPGKSQKSSFILTQNPESLLKFYEENKNKNLPGEFVDLCKSLKKHDNPVIMLFDIEDF